MRTVMCFNITTSGTYYWYQIDSKLNNSSTNVLFIKIATSLCLTQLAEVHDLSNRAMDTHQTDYVQNGKMNEFVLGGKSMVDRRTRIRPSPSCAGHVFRHKTHPLAFCTAMKDALAWMNPYQQVKYHFHYSVSFQTWGDSLSNGIE